MTYYIGTDLGNRSKFYIQVPRETALQYRRKATEQKIKLGFDQIGKSRFYYVKQEA